MEIRLANQNESQDILNVLDEARKHLYEKGIFQWDEGFDVAEVTSDITIGPTYVVTENNQMIGTFSLKEKQYDLISKQPCDSFWYLYQVALLPKYQGIGLGRTIISFCAECKQPLYLDCWAGNEKLRQFYSQAGFKWLGDVKEADYMISIFLYIWK